MKLRVYKRACVSSVISWSSLLWCGGESFGLKIKRGLWFWGFPSVLHNLVMKAVSHIVCGLFMPLSRLVFIYGKLKIGPFR